MPRPTPTPADGTDDPGSVRARTDRLWGDVPAPRRGPRPDLSLEGIVAAAVAMADSEGLTAVSMRRVAEAVGSAPMALYRHVPNKQDLLELMVDLACGWAPTLDDRAGWRSGVDAWARALLEVYLAHRWVHDVSLPSLVFGPRRLSWLEAGLTAFVRTPLEPVEAARLVLGLDAVVRGCAQLVANLESAGGGSDELASIATLEQIVLERLDGDRYPLVRDLVQGGAFTPPSGARPDAAGRESFEVILAVVLDGVQTLLDRGS